MLSKNQFKNQEQEQNSPKSKNTLILVLATVLIIFLLVAVSYAVYFTVDFKKEGVVAEESDSEISEEFERLVGERIDNEDLSVYKIYITKVGDTSSYNIYNPDGYSNFVDYVMAILNVGSSSKYSWGEQISKVFYDINTTEVYDWKDIQQNNSEYLLLLEPGSSKPELNRTYLKEGLEIRVQNTNEKIIPYLNDNRYCEADSDCSIGNFFCGYGSWNNYRPYIDVWGCGDNLPTEIYPQEKKEDLERYCVSSYDVSIEYKNARCVSNTCIPTNSTIACL